ncbi:hypothetical protein, partial [Acinetobacter baumannii]
NRMADRGNEAPGATGPASGTGPHGQTQPQGMKPRPDMGNPDSRGQGESALPGQEKAPEVKAPDSQGQKEGGQIAPKQLNQ